MTRKQSKFFITGGAGFIGSHFVDHLLRETATTRVTVYDNFSVGKKAHLFQHFGDKRLTVVEGDIEDESSLSLAIKNHDVVIHLAANSDIAKATEDPDIDFRFGTFLTRNVLRAMAKEGVPTILYASGSGVYGDWGDKIVNENTGPLIPISPYGASKLASEALISSYSFMNDLRGFCFRFANVVGPRQTHGVGFDFIQKLKNNPKSLEILGDGKQSKSYLYVTDVCEAVLMALSFSPESFSVFNVATLDFISVNEIAECVVQFMGHHSVEFKWTGGNRGWRGDVPIVRLDSQKIRALGWSNQYTSSEAILKSLETMLGDRA